jgi:hypothetical protein
VVHENFVANLKSWRGSSWRRTCPGVACLVPKPARRLTGCNSGLVAMVGEPSTSSNQAQIGSSCGASGGEGLGLAAPVPPAPMRASIAGPPALPPRAGAPPLAVLASRFFAVLPHTHAPRQKTTARSVASQDGCLSAFIIVPRSSVPPVPRWVSGWGAHSATRLMLSSPSSRMSTIGEPRSNEQARTSRTAKPE